MAAGSTYTPIATQTLGSAAASVTFSSISGAYTDLVLVLSTTVASTGAVEFVVGNGSVDTGSNYSRTYIYGDGSIAASGRASTQTKLYLNAGVTNFNTSIAHFMNYSNTTTYKTILGRGSDANTIVNANVNLWRSTSAINIITLTGASANLAAGSTFSLYGIQSA